MSDIRIAIFKGKEIRKTIHQNEWWFSVVDVVEVLTETDRPRKYWSDLKTKLVKEGYTEVSEKIGHLKLPAPDGKLRETDCANAGGDIAGGARRKLEKRLGRSIVSKENYLPKKRGVKQLT